MPLFGRISELFTRRTTPRQHSERQDPNAIPPPSSDAISDQVQRTQTSGARNASILPIGSDFVGQSQFPVQSINSTLSYARGFPPASESRPVRSLLRQTIPRLGLGMSRLQAEDKSMHSKEHPISSQDDESRLFPTYDRPSPNGVPIVPGQTTYTKKKNPLQNPFSPIDTISHKGRESGPVPAKGKQGRHTGGNVRRAGAVAGYESPERPPKRRRRESQESLAGRTINLSDDDIMQQSFSRLSPTSSQLSGKTKRPRDAKRGTLDEYRQVEKNVRINRSQASPKHRSKNHLVHSDDDGEELFTENAAKQRRSSNARLEVFQSVEIQRPNDLARDRDVAKSPPLSSQFIGTDGRRRNSDLRDSQSSDELQGAATVQPASEFMAERRKGGGGSNSEEQSETAVRQPSSPADIQPTVFGSSRQGHGVSKRKNIKSGKSGPTHQIFQATSVRYGALLRSISDGEKIELDVNIVNDTITMSGLDLTNPLHIPFKRVIQVLEGQSPSRKVRLQLSRTEEVGDNTADIEFLSSNVKEDFCSLFKDRVTVHQKESKWMDDAFKKSRKDLARYPNGSKRPCAAIIPEIFSKTKDEVTKRPKLSSSLENDNGSAPISETAPQEPSKLSRPISKSDEASDVGTIKTRSSKEDHEDGVEIPVKKYKPDLPPSSRATRSTSRRTCQSTVVCDDDVNEGDNPQLKSKMAYKKWCKPLVYPRFGKKKAEVDAQDRERLRDNEFLNDNLIGFYIRFLEDHLDRSNKDVSKRVYFFNSYFFATLTNLPAGKRGINYEGVQKWTRNVDIFSHDYIVVPINEAAHWYVAIICNLPSLQGISQQNTELEKPMEGEKESSALLETDTPEIPNTPDASREVLSSNEETETVHKQNAAPAKEELTMQSFASMSLFDKKESKDNELREISPSDEEWPEREEDLTSPPAKFSSPVGKTQPSKQIDSVNANASALPETPKSRKQKKKRLGPKYDVRQPIIITFDSLNLARSPTIKVLREYLFEEAKSKRGIEIDTSLVKGMKAQEIPLQPNYWDCGLYLLAYVEKFVQDPDSFVIKLLRKEMRTEDDWPVLKSGLLRYRLRKFLDDLYDEQEQLSREKANEKNTMVDRQPMSYLLGPPEPKSTLDDADTKQSQPEHLPEEGSSEKPGSEPAKSEEDIVHETQDIAVYQLNDHTADSGQKQKWRLAQEPTKNKVETSICREEIIEVPDSQEQNQRASDSSTTKVIPKEDAKSRLGQVPDSQDTVSDDFPIPVQLPERKAGSVRVEVQVARTPPPGISTSTQDSVRKSPRTPKQKV